MAPDFDHQRVLLLQGPNGPFFRRLARELRAKGVQVTKVNFHAGDAFFFPGPDALAFRGKPEDLPAWLTDVLRKRDIQAIYLFGDGRPYHQVAIEIAKRMALRIHVFEEGYLRPDWITLEEGGVNGFSSMPREPAFFHEFARGRRLIDGHEHVGRTFGIGALYATLLALAATLAFFRYRQYRHHRSINSWLQMCLWVRGAFRKYWYRWRERHILKRLEEQYNRRYFLVALQVYCDYQVVHSPFKTVEEFIENVVRSFARHAAADCALVFKHHPMDRAYRDYGRLLKRLASEYGVGSRLIYVHDLHLPRLLRNARGAVMINSTVGLQAISYGTPVKVLGNAVYDMPGLTFAGDLERFWQEQGRVDDELYRAFRTYLLYVNQANGSFAKRLRGVSAPSGIRWFPGIDGRTDQRQSS